MNTRMEHFIKEKVRYSTAGRLKTTCYGVGVKKRETGLIQALTALALRRTIIGPLLRSPNQRWKSYCDDCVDRCCVHEVWGRARKGARDLASRSKPGNSRERTARTARTGAPVKSTGRLP